MAAASPLNRAGVGFLGWNAAFLGSHFSVGMPRLSIVAKSLRSPRCSPPQVLCALAGQDEFDALVIGSRGRSSVTTASGIGLAVLRGARAVPGGGGQVQGLARSLSGDDAFNAPGPMRRWRSLDCGHCRWSAFASLSGLGFLRWQLAGIANWLGGALQTCVRVFQNYDAGSIYLA